MEAHTAFHICAGGPRDDVGPSMPNNPAAPSTTGHQLLTSVSSPHRSLIEALLLGLVAVAARAWVRAPWHRSRRGRQSWLRPVLRARREECATGPHLARGRNARLERTGQHLGPGAICGHHDWLPGAERSMGHGNRREQLDARRKAAGRHLLGCVRALETGRGVDRPGQGRTEFSKRSCEHVGHHLFDGRDVAREHTLSPMGARVRPAGLRAAGNAGRCESSWAGRSLGHRCSQRVGVRGGVGHRGAAAFTVACLARHCPLTTYLRAAQRRR